MSRPPDRKRIPKKRPFGSRKKYIVLGITALLALLLSVDNSWAKNESAKPLKVEKINETVDCFDYYEFGSIKTDILSDASLVFPGTDIGVTAEVKNTNDYPVVDGSLFVKIYRKQTDQKAAQGKGDFLMDQFFVAEDIVLGEKASKEVRFKWKVPKELPMGEYYIATYFQSAKKFNLAGLSFTDDVMGSTYPFTVKGKQHSGYAEFDKNNVKLDGEPFNFIGFMKPRDNKDMVVEAPLVNTTAAKQEVTITYELYYWDSLLAENRIDLKEEKVSIEPGKTQVVAYTVKQNDFPANYLVITAKNKDGKSLLGIRFGKKDQERARLNFPAVSDFPLEKGTSSELFACFHLATPIPTNIPDSVILENPELKEQLEGKTDAEAEKIVQHYVEGKRYGENQDGQGAYSLNLAIKDQKGTVVRSFVYRGAFSGEMSAVRSTFEAPEDLDVFTLEASIKDSKGMVHDKATMHYDCKQINSKLCKSLSAGSAADGKEVARDSNTSKKGVAALGVVIMLLLLAGIGFIARKKGLIGNRIPLWFILLFPGVLLAATQAEAKNSFPSVDKPETLAYQSASYFEDHDYWWTMFQLDSVNIEYTTINSRGEIDGTPISAGDSFTVAASYKGDWTLTGYLCDTPPVHWAPNAEYLDEFKEYDSDLYIDDHVSSRYYRIWFPFVFNPPTISLGSTGPITCTKQKDALWSCTVNDNATPGEAITLQLDYSDTYGKVYSRSISETKKGEQKELYESVTYRTLMCTKNAEGFCNYSQAFGPLNQCNELEFVTCKPWENSRISTASNEGQWCSGCDEGKINVASDSGITYRYTVSEPVPGNETVSIELKTTAGEIITAYDGESATFAVNGDSASPRITSAFGAGRSLNNGPYVGTGLSQSLVVYEPIIVGYSYSTTDYSGCKGTNSGLLSDEGRCTVVIKYDGPPPASPGTCGTAARTYGLGDPFPGSYTMCNIGNPDNPAISLPNTAGATTSWICNAAGGNSPLCPANRASCSPSYTCASPNCSDDANCGKLLNKTCVSECGFDCSAVDCGQERCTICPGWQETP